MVILRFTAVKRPSTRARGEHGGCGRRRGKRANRGASGMEKKGTSICTDLLLEPANRTLIHPLSARGGVLPELYDGREINAGLSSEEDSFCTLLLHISLL